MRLLLMALSVVLFSWPVAGQPPSNVPLQVDAKKSLYVNEMQQFSITLRNDSEKAVVGYVIKFTRLGSNGEDLDSLGIGGLSYDFVSERKKPGDTWDLMLPAMTTNVPREIAADVRIEVDFVLFADSKSTGPDTLGRGMMLRGELDGVLGERARLRSILRREGVDKLVKVLEAPEWDRGRAN